MALMTLINAIPNYQPAPSCGNCNHGYDHVVDGSRNCSLHCGIEVVRGYVCDDWRPVDWRPGWGTVWTGKPPYTLATASTYALVSELATRQGVSRYSVGVEDDYLVRIRPDCGDSTSIFNHGPATILVVID